MTIRRRQHDLSPPDQFARRVAVANQSLKLSTVSWANLKADVGTSYPTNVEHQAADGHPVSDG